MAKATKKRRVVEEEDDDEDVATEGDELEDSRMPFLEHLRELRDRVKKAGLFFCLAFVVCWWFSTDIFHWLEAPIRNAWYTAGVKANTGREFHMVYKAATEPFWVGMSIGLWAGIFVGSPFIFYQLWKFIAPGLYKRERRITVWFSICSALFFCAGALFCYYFVLENLYGFLLSYTDKELEAQLVMGEYLDLTRDMMLAFGAVFELPLLILFLAMVGLVTHRGLWKFNRWFIVLAFIIGAILTPSPDVVSQIMMATPMIVLYNLSILLAWYVTARREKREAELRAKEAAADEEERARRRAKGLPVRDEDGDDDDDDDDDDDE